jgi:putative heme iron utilization protein
MVHSSPESGLIVATAQSLMYESRIAALATLESATNHPYASLIAIAPDVDGAPVFLISNLALHTRNLDADSRASILLTEQAKGNPLNSGRVSLIGRAAPVDAPNVRRGFLRCHPEAVGYADFADFRFWRLTPERAHYVGGFGRIVTLQAMQILLSCEQARLWAGAETEIEALNAEAPELIQELAGYCEGAAGGWRIAACDPYGCDLSRGSDTRRLAFAAKLDDPAGLQSALLAILRRKVTEGP